MPTTVEEIDFAAGEIVTAILDVHDDADAARVRMAIAGLIEAGAKNVGLMLLMALGERIGGIAIGGPQ